MNPQSKYQIDTPENRAFLEECRQDLLRFGTSFLLPAEVPITCPTMDHHGLIVLAKHGLPAGWSMSTAWAFFWGMKAAKRWSTPV